MASVNRGCIVHGKNVGLDGDKTSTGSRCIAARPGMSVMESGNSISAIRPHLARNVGKSESLLVEITDKRTAKRSPLMVQSSIVTVQVDRTS